MQWRCRGSQRPLGSCLSYCMHDSYSGFRPSDRRLYVRLASEGCSKGWGGAYIAWDNRVRGKKIGSHTSPTTSHAAHSSQRLQTHECVLLCVHAASSIRRRRVRASCHADAEVL